MPPPPYDVFLSHNRRDKEAVRELAAALRARQIAVWLDEDCLVPGELWQKALETVIATVGAGAVLVGKDGLGPWEDLEMRGLLSQAVGREDLSWRKDLSRLARECRGVVVLVGGGSPPWEDLELRSSLKVFERRRTPLVLGQVGGSVAVSHYRLVAPPDWKSPPESL